MPYLTDEEINERIARESNRANGLARIGQAEQQEWASWMPKPEIEKVKPERTLGGTLQNLGVGLGKGVMQTGASVVGLADIPTGGYAGKGLEAVGVDFGDWAEDIGEYYTPAQKAAMERRSQNLSEADTFGGKLKAIASEPSTIVQDVVESLPMMVGGAGIARGILGVNKGYQALATADKIRRGITAGAIGEGTMAAGSAAEDIRSQTDDGTLSLGQTGAAIGTGIGTGALGIIGGRIANKLGISDVDTLFATGQLAEKSNKGVIRRILEGGISEGVFEELPQSAQEQIWLNAALGKDLTEGVEEAGAAGLLAGAAMGGAGNVVTRGDRGDATIDQTLSQEEQDLATIQNQIQETVASYDQANPDETINKLNELYQQEKDLKNKMAGDRYEVPLPEDIDEINRQISNLETVENPNRGTVELLEQLRQHKENLPNIIAQRRMHEQRADQQGLYENLMSPEQDILTRSNENFQETVKTLEESPRKLRPNDMLTRAGKPYERRDYLKNFLADQDNSNDYEIVEVNLKDAYQAEKNRLQQELNAGRYLGREAVLNELNDLENKIENISDPDQTGYVARLTDDALDKQRPEIIAEREVLLSDYQQLGEDTNAFDVKIDSIKKQQRIKEIDRELASEDVKKDPEKRRELNRELASIFTDIDRVMSGRFQRDFEIGRTERIDQIVEEAPTEEGLITQPGMTPVSTQAEPTVERMVQAEEPPTIQAQEDIVEDIQAKEDLISEMESELEANLIEQNRLGVNDPRREELQFVAEELQTQIQDGKREILVDRLTAGPKAQFLTSEEVADFRKANNLPEIKMREDNSHPTQIGSKRQKDGKWKGTASTYEKVWNLMPEEIQQGKILDYGAGKNIGSLTLADVREIDSFEPYPEAGFNPTYKDTSQIPSNTYDGIFNNAVLNVVPDDIRNAIVSEIGRVLAPGGKAYINVRGKDVLGNPKAKTRPIVIPGGNMEVIANISNAYQKGFTKTELVNYLQETLGDNFSVTAGKFGAVGAIVTKKEATPGQFQTGEQQVSQPLTFPEIKEMYPGQDVIQSEDGTISVRFKNGKGVKIQSIQDAGNGFVQMAIDTGQMSKNGRILGVTMDNTILLDSEFADKKTAWHENEHLLENLGMIKPGDISALNKEFNKLRKTDGLDFTLSTHEDPKQAMAENRANMFAEIMVNREAYRDTPLGAMIQRVMDFFNSLYLHGRRFVTGADYQNVRGLAGEVESGRLYNREPGDQTPQDTMFEVAGNVNSEEFKNWFGNSVAKTRDGIPAKFYHGTPNEFTEFKEMAGSSTAHSTSGLGHFFSMDKDYAANYAKDGGNVIETYLKMEKPYKMPLEQAQGLETIDDAKRAKEQLRAKGYDSVIIPIPGAQPYIAVFDANQIKSTANRGTWDSSNPDIRFQTTELKDALGKKNNISRRDFLKGLGGLFVWGYTGINPTKILASTETFNNLLNQSKQTPKNILKWISTNSESKQYKKLAKDLLELVPFNSLQLKLDPRNMTADGSSRINREDKSITVTLYKTGRNETTFLHELIHSAVQARYDLLRYSLANPEILGEVNAKDALTQYQNVWNEFGKQVELYAQKNNQNLSDLPSWLNIPYASPDEFLTYVLTEPKLRDFMAQYQYTDKTLLEKLKDTIKKFFDRVMARFSWLDAVTMTSDELFTAMKKDPPDYKPSTKLNVYINKTEKNSVDSQTTQFRVNKELKDANWDKKYPKINFEVREQLNIPEQTIPESEYIENQKQHRDMVARTKQALKSTGRSLNRTLNKYLGVTSTNLLKIHPMLQAKAKRLDFDTIKRIQANLKVATPVLEKMGKMSKNDRADFSWAVKNGDFGKIVSLTRSYNFTEEYQALQNMLDTIHQELKDVGYRPGYVENYWPRAIKDYEGFLLATQEISQEPIFTKALEQQAKKLGKEVNELSPDMRANIIAQKIEDVKLGVGGPGNIHQRVYEKIPIDLGKYYAGASASLVNYIYSTSKNIEGRRFFGKVPPKIKNAREIVFNKTNEIEALEKQKAELVATNQDTTEIDNQITAKQEYIDDHQKKLEEYGQVGEFHIDIGAYIDELMTKGLLKPENEKTLKDILEARFYEHGVTGTANVFKNISLIDTMGSPLSAITQIQDLGFSVYVGGLTPRGITNSVRNIGKALAKRSDIKKEDLGLEWISQEFADPDTLSRALNRVFKLTGLDRMDTIGKELLINNSYDNYRVKAENKDKLFKEIRHMFGSDKETNEVINDLKNDKKDSNNVQFLVFSRLLDFQPATKSEMAEKALTLGNWRLAYLLKSFTIKQIDVFRRDVWHKLKEGHKNNDKAMILEGMRNMGMLLGLLSLAGAGADELKDIVLGKDIKFEDHFIEQLASLGGANRYLRMQVRKEGAGTALGKQILPPFKFIDAVTKDTAQNTWDLDTGRWVDSIPLAGTIYYWRMGRAAQYRSSSEEKELNKDKKEFKKFETGLEEATDKRLYIRSNYDTFKQKKLYDNFSKALRGNKKTIDKLKDIDQTPNVKKRLNQLEQQRYTLINRYFEMKDNI